MANASEFDRVLNECLDRVLTSGESVEACLKRYPQHAQELAPLLHLAVATRSVLDFTPSVSTKARARLLLQAAIARQETRKERRWHWPRSPRLAGSYRWAIGTAAAVILMAVGGSGIVAASNDSTPDQPLYPIKRMVEEARLVFTLSSDAKARLHASFAERRVKEIGIMGRRGKADRIASLTAALDRHLRRIQRSAFPHALPARPLANLEAILDGELQTPVSIVPRVATPPPGDHEETLRQLRRRPSQFQRREALAELRPLPPELRQAKRALHQQLEAGFARHEEALKQAIEEARGPAKQMLQRALRTLQEHRRALLTALEEQATPTRPSHDAPTGRVRPSRGPAELETSVDWL